MGEQRGAGLANSVVGEDEGVDQVGFEERLC
jgi:hypothetical protein